MTSVCIDLEASRPVSQVRPYFLYLLECRGGRLYAGIAVDVEARFKKHLLGNGAKFTRAWPPLRILESRPCGSRSEALRAEIALKRLPRSKKRAYFHHE